MNKRSMDFSIPAIEPDISNIDRQVIIKPDLLCTNKGKSLITSSDNLESQTKDNI